MNNLTIFIHIPKTGGTSLREAFLEGIPEEERVLLYPGILGHTAAQVHDGFDQARKDAVRYVFGHCSYGAHKYLGRPAARYVTFLREPGRRLWSNAAHHLSAGASVADVRAVVEEPASEEFDNVCVRALAGLEGVPFHGVTEEHVDRAFTNVVRDFSFVGRSEDSARDLLALRLGLDLPAVTLGRENVSDFETLAGGAMASWDWERIMTNNRHDIELYRRLRDSGMMGWWRP